MAREHRPPCLVCTEAEGMTDGHHVIPLEYGGEQDGKKVPLCSLCHRGIHREAEALSRGEDASGKFSGHLKTEAQTRRFDVLVNYIVEAKRRHMASSPSGKAETARNMVSVSLTGDQLRMLHAVKQSYGMTNMSNVVVRLIETAYASTRTKTRSGG